MQHNNSVYAAQAASSKVTFKPNGQPPQHLAMHIIRRVAKKKDIEVEMMLNSSRCRRRIAEARQQAMYLAHVIAGLSLSSVGQVFGRDRTTIRYACARVEDRRDDRAYDTELSQLETEVAEMMEKEH